jgi:hypothetical protein
MEKEMTDGELQKRAETLKVFKKVIPLVPSARAVLSAHDQSGKQ